LKCGKCWQCVFIGKLHEFYYKLHLLPVVKYGYQILRSDIGQIRMIKIELFNGIWYTSWFSKCLHSEVVAVTTNDDCRWSPVIYATTASWALPCIPRQYHNSTIGTIDYSTRTATSPSPIIYTNISHTCAVVIYGPQCIHKWRNTWLLIFISPIFPIDDWRIEDS